MSALRLYAYGSIRASYAEFACRRLASVELPESQWTRFFTVVERGRANVAERLSLSAGLVLEKFYQSLVTDERLLYRTLLTWPDLTCFGAARISIVALAEACAIEPQRVEEMLTAFEAARKITREGEHLFVHDFRRHQGWTTLTDEAKCAILNAKEALPPGLFRFISRRLGVTQKEMKSARKHLREARKATAEKTRRRAEGLPEGVAEGRPDLRSGKGEGETRDQKSVKEKGDGGEKSEEEKSPRQDDDLSGQDSPSPSPEEERKAKRLQYRRDLLRSHLRAYFKQRFANMKDVDAEKQALGLVVGVVEHELRRRGIDHASDKMAVKMAVSEFLRQAAPAFEGFNLMLENKGEKSKSPPFYATNFSTDGFLDFYVQRLKGLPLAEALVKGK